jgi:hypothetical protein
LPLRVCFLLAAQRKAIHALVLEIPKHRLHDGDPFVVSEPPNKVSNLRRIVSIGLCLPSS